MKITRFEDIDAWKAAREFRRMIHAVCRAESFKKDVDLQRQMRRAATSGMANIAEGFDSGTDPEFRRFLRIARRSVSELQSHLYIALDDGCITQEQFDQLYAKALDVKRLIGGFIRYLRGNRKS